LASAAPVLLRDVAADKITHCSDGCVPMSPATSAACRVRSGGHQRRETDRHSLAEKCQPAGRMTAITVGLHNLNHDESVSVREVGCSLPRRSRGRQATRVCNTTRHSIRLFLTGVTCPLVLPSPPAGFIRLRRRQRLQSRRAIATDRTEAGIAFQPLTSTRRLSSKQWRVSNGKVQAAGREPCRRSIRVHIAIAAGSIPDLPSTESSRRPTSTTATALPRRNQR